MPRLLPAALLLLLACAPAAPTEDPLARLYSQPGAAVLAQTERVEVFRVSPEPGGEGPAIGEHAITATGPAVAPELRDALLKILEDPRSYAAQGKRCEFMPGVGLRLWRGTEAVEVALCFSCDQIRVYVRGPDGTLAHTGRGDFDPARAELVGLVQRALPGDPEIAALKPVR